MRRGPWMTLCSYLPCALLLLLCLDQGEASWSPWSDTACFLEPSAGRLCIARQERDCVCPPNSIPTCPCSARRSRLMGPPASSQFCTSDCKALGTWCPWSQWYQTDASSCRVTVIERTRKCCAENSHVSIDLNQCVRLGLSNNIQRRMRYVYNCRTSPIGRLAGVFGTVFVIVCILTIVVLLRLRARRRRLRIMAQERQAARVNATTTRPFIIASPGDDPYANAMAPVCPPSYSEVHSLPPPPPYELHVPNPSHVPERFPLSPDNQNLR